MSCDPIKGCRPDTHNLHCGYPTCQKGMNDAQSKPAQLTVEDLIPLAKLGLNVLELAKQYIDDNKWEIDPSDIMECAEELKVVCDFDDTETTSRIRATFYE